MNKKTFLLLFLLFFFAGKLYCQPVLVDSSKEQLWYICKVGIVGPNDTTIGCISEVLKKEDTEILNGKNYFKIMRTEESSLASWEEIGHVREEDNRVYYMPSYDTIEFLLYDFTLNIGDTIKLVNTIYADTNNREYIVTDIDSIDLTSGKKKRITLDSEDPEIWIEGMGSLRGLIYSALLIIGGYRELVCYYENENKIYQNPEYDFCFYTPSVVDDKNEQEFLIYSNPSSEILTIEGLTNTQLNIFNLSGSLVFSFNIEYNIQDIDISGLTPGIYVIKVISSKIYYHYKFVKSF